MLHWNRAYRDLMAHPAVVPILEQLCGARFRLDHINVHTHVAAGYSGSSLHGGSNPGGGNGFYHYQGGQMRNGLVAVTWELEDTHCNGGGFCCIPGSERATPSLSRAPLDRRLRRPQIQPASAFRPRPLARAAPLRRPDPGRPGNLHHLHGGHVRSLRKLSRSARTRVANLRRDS